MSQKECPKCLGDGHELRTCECVECGDLHKSRVACLFCHGKGYVAAPPKPASPAQRSE